MRNLTDHDPDVDNEQFVADVIADLMWTVPDELRVKLVKKMAEWKASTRSRRVR